MSTVFDVNLSTGRWPFRDLPLADLADLRAKLTVSGISGGLVRSLEAPFTMNIYEANEKLMKYCQGFPEFIPAPAVRPDFPLWREIDARAVVLYPGYHQFSLTSPECLEMLGELFAASIVPVIVIREEDERGQHPLCKVTPVATGEIVQAAEAFPDNDFVVLNGYSGEINELTAKNIYADIAFADGFPALANVVRNFDSKRLLFGSHAPFFCVNSELSKLQYEKLDEQDISSITWKNSERIFYGK